MWYKLYIYINYNYKGTSAGDPCLWGTKPVVSCRFSLKPIHWKTWDSPVSDCHSLQSTTTASIVSEIFFFGDQIDVSGISEMGMDQYLLIPFLVGWTSIYQLFWCSPGVQGFWPIPNGDVISLSISALIRWSDGRWIAEGPLVSPSARRKQVGDHGVDLRIYGPIWGWPRMWATQ